MMLSKKLKAQTGANPKLWVLCANETDQLRLKIEANELKRDAEISKINAQTQNIIQKYSKRFYSSGNLNS